MINNRKQKNTLLGCLILMLFSYPILGIFNHAKTVDHVPVLYLYISIIWCLSLVMLIIAAEAKPFQKIKRKK